MRVPQLEVQKESLVQMPYTRWEEIQGELDAKSQQIEELTTRYNTEYMTLCHFSISLT